MFGSLRTKWHKMSLLCLSSVKPLIITSEIRLWLKRLNHNSDGSLLLFLIWNTNLSHTQFVVYFNTASIALHFYSIQQGIKSLHKDSVKKVSKLNLLCPDHKDEKTYTNLQFIWPFLRTMPVFHLQNNTMKMNYYWVKLLLKCLTWPN